MTTPTLTERYLFAAARDMPAAQRDDFRRELAARIGDAVDARLEDGAAPDDAERAVLQELGRPDVLAASYADRPLQLVGPAYYLTWKRLLTLLVAIVLPVVAAVSVLAHLIEGDGAGATIGLTFVAVLTVAVYLGTGTTAVFAVLDRAGGGKPLAGWTPDQLPAATEPSRRELRVDAAANFVMIGLAAVVILVGPHLVPPPDGAASVPLLADATWGWLPWCLLVVLALQLVFWLALLRRGRWTYGFALVSLVLALAWSVPVAVTLARGTFFNPGYVSRTDWADGPEQLDAGGPLAVVLAVLVVAVAAAWPIDAFVKARRQRLTPH
jgi:hypothetical protein